MNREEFIQDFIARWGENLAMNLRGEHTYLVPISYLVQHGVKKTLQDAERGSFPDVTGKPEAEQNIPDNEVVQLIAAIQGVPAAPVGLYKLPDDPLGITRVSLGGNTQEAVYLTYRGPINDAVRIMEIALHLLKQQAEKGEAPFPPNPSHN